MNSPLAYHFFKKFEADVVSLIYTGEFDDELTSTLMRVNESSIGEPNKFSKRLSYLLAECFQNIIRHAEKPAIINRTNNKPKMFAIRCTEHIFNIASSNLINNNKRDDLHQMLRKLNTLTKEELKEVYMEAFTNNEYSSKGGGGLGLIEMARKSDYPMQYEFENVNFYFSNFFMQMSVRAKDTEEAEGEKKEMIRIGSIRELYHEVIEQDIMLIRKGDFSQQTILPLLELLGNNINSKKALPGLNKKISYILIEMLQNISKHGSLHNGIHDGIFIIGLKDEKYTIHTGNYIEVDHVEGLKKDLDTLLNMDETGLSWAYRNKLLNSEPGKKGGAGIGLIEVAKYSTQKMRYHFKPVTDTLSFFSLSITV